MGKSQKKKAELAAARAANKNNNLDDKDEDQNVGESSAEEKAPDTAKEKVSEESKVDTIPEEKSAETALATEETVAKAADAADTTEAPIDQVEDGADKTEEAPPETPTKPEENTQTAETTEPVKTPEANVPLPETPATATFPSSESALVPIVPVVTQPASVEVKVEVAPPAPPAPPPKPTKTKAPPPWGATKAPAVVSTPTPPPVKTPIVPTPTPPPVKAPAVIPIPTPPPVKAPVVIPTPTPPPPSTTPAPVTVATDAAVRNGGKRHGSHRARSSFSSSTLSVIEEPDLGELKQVVEGMKGCLATIATGFESLGVETSRAAALKPAIDSAKQIKHIRHKLKAHEIKQDAQVKTLETMLTTVLKEKIADEIRADLGKVITTEVERQVRDEVTRQMAIHIPILMEKQGKEHRRQILEIRKNLHNSESRRANSLLKSNNLFDPLHPLLRPNGEKCSIFPKTLASVFSSGSEVARLLCHEYNLPETESKESNLNRFLHHIGVGFQMVATPMAGPEGPNTPIIGEH